MWDTVAIAAAAGAVNGTFSDKSHSARTVTDTENKLSISGGQLVFAGGKAAPAFGDPGISVSAISRVAGRILLLSITEDSAIYNGFYGWGNTSAPATAANFDAGIHQWGDLGLYTEQNIEIGVRSNTTYQWAFVLRTSGTYYFVKGGLFTNWVLMWIKSTTATATLYPAISSYNITSIFTNLRVPRRLWLPEPIAYDAFTRADGPLGVSDVVGPDSQVCVSRTWSFPAGTASISGNAAVISPTAGGELLTDGGLENWASATDLTSWTETIGGTSTVNREDTVKRTGTYACRLDVDATTNIAKIEQPYTGATVGAWYRLTAWMKSNIANKEAAFTLAQGALASVPLTTTYAQYALTARATADPLPLNIRRGALSASSSIYIDDVSVVPLTLASLFSSLTDAKTADVKVRTKCKVLVTGTQMGAMARLDSTTNPANFIIAYFDGAGNIECDECVNGTYNALIAAVAKAFTAEDLIEIDVVGNAVRVYHVVNATGAATLIGTATATANVNTNHGKFSTYVGNSFSSVLVEPKGTNDNAWAALDSL